MHRHSTQDAWLLLRASQKEEQEIFESLQRQSTGAFSTPRSSRRRTPPRINQSPDSSEVEVQDAQATIESRVDKIAASATNDGK